MVDVIGLMKIGVILIARQVEGGSYEMRLKGFSSANQLVTHILDDGTREYWRVRCSLWIHRR